MKALLLENIHPEGVRLLTERGIEVETVRGALDEAELIHALPGVQLLGIRSKTNVTETVLEAVPDLMAIGALASRCSTRLSPIPAAWWSWLSRRSLLSPGI
jgi:D-3-phosphoglycerate dehydrogenase